MLQTFHPYFKEHFSFIQYTMFKDPKTYSENHLFQQDITIDALNRFTKYLTWKDNEFVLDIGSGCGNTTSQILLPFLSESCQQLIGADKSKEMVLHAQKENKVSKLSFVQFDIEERDQCKMHNTFSAMGVHQGFDKIFSFFCLHWVKNIRYAIENIYSLTKPGGQCLVVLVEKAMQVNVWRALKRKERWNEYLEKEEEFEETYPTFFIENLKEEFCSALKASGFEITECEQVKKEIKFDISSIIDIKYMASIDPWIQYIPKHLHEAYMKDCMQELAKISLEKNGNYFYVIELLVALFCKPNG